MRCPRLILLYVNVIEVKGKFQACLQVPGDGRGGAKKRKHQALPALFETAEDAAVYLASCKQGIAKQGWSTGEGAARIDPVDKKHKPRTPKQPAAAVPPAATASHHHSGDANSNANAMPGFCARIAATDAATGLLPTTCLILLYDDTYGTYSCICI